MDADVIVIGAGAAGLAAAQSLARSSARVHVMEARDRVGGRVWTHPQPGVTAPVELGAEFIHGRARATMALLRAAGISTTVPGNEAWTKPSGGELLREPMDSTDAAKMLEGARSLAHDESADRYLRRLEADSALREAAKTARAFIEGFDAADPAIASAQAIVQEWRSGVDFTIARPRGGYGPIFERLRNACTAAGIELSLSTIVRRISWRRGFVAVETQDDHGDARTIRARTAIVTLPVGVLRHSGDETAVAFDPDLPPAKHKALGNLEMGHAIRIPLWFRRPFWEQVRNGLYRNGAFFRGQGLPFATYWTQFPVHSELVVAWAGGPKALAMSGDSPADLIEHALDGLGSLFDEPDVVRKTFAGGTLHNWSRDPFARGAYSYVRVGGRNARAALAAPVDDTLFFAGEATSTDGQGGTVSGALETGRRAAAEAAAALGAKSH